MVVAVEAAGLQYGWPQCVRCHRCANQGSLVLLPLIASCHSAAGWAGLIINAINCLPAGELDGGRTFLGLFGRRAASRMGAGED